MVDGFNRAVWVRFESWKPFGLNRVYRQTVLSIGFKVKKKRTPLDCGFDVCYIETFHSLSHSHKTISTIIIVPSHPDDSRTFITMGMNRRQARRKRQLLWNKDGPFCQLCRREFSSVTDKDLTLDHICPQFLGGGHELSNLRLACRECNHDYSRNFFHLVNQKRQELEATNQNLANRRRRQRSAAKRKFKKKATGPNKFKVKSNKAKAC